MATYAIGDVQGCFTTLLALLDTIAFDRSRDQLWFTGDLVNRGPRSLAVLRFISALGKSAVTVLGNHDLHLLAVAHGQGPYKPRDTFTDVLHAPDREPLLAWLRHQPLLYHHAPLGMTMVHAGLPPQWNLALAQTHAAEVEAVLQSTDFPVFLRHLENTAATQRTPAPEKWARLCYSSNCLTRLRYCDAQGRLLLDDKDSHGAQPVPYFPWFTIPARASAALNLVFGHWATLGTCTAPGVHHLDTGCVWGGTLTAMCLETRERFSVPCRDVCTVPGR